MDSSENLRRLGSNPGAVVNTDHPGLKAYREAREKIRQRNKEFEQLKTDVADMKSMMSQILEKLSK